MRHNIYVYYQQIDLCLIDTGRLLRPVRVWA